MYRKFRLSIALDIDDVLMECVPYAVRLANEKYQFHPPLSIFEVDRWGKLGTRADVIFEFFEDPEFFKNQPVMKGAKEFVQKLSQVAEVFVSTSVRPEFMGIRAERIRKEFPEIHPDHIYMGSRKDKIDVDILFDDGMHNVFGSNAKYPILLRRPWNREATGVLAVNNYEQFLKLVEIIAADYKVNPEQSLHKEPGIVVLVGPSGSGKNEVAREILTKTKSVEKLISYTTSPWAAEPGHDGRYHYITEEEFFKHCASGEFFEYTTYANHGFASKKQDVEKILSEGRHVLTVMDICGAMAMKTHFRNVVTVYIKCDRKLLLKNILEDDATVEEKINRILAVDGETDNAQLCDYVIRNDNVSETAERICEELKLI
jgi:guanylate kinase